MSNTPDEVLRKFKAVRGKSEPRVTVKLGGVSTITYRGVI